MIERLISEGQTIDRAIQYVDLVLEYREATENIERNGVIVQHPRTMNPIDNPYLKVRDKARKALDGYRKIKADWMWASRAEPSRAEPSRVVS